MSGDEEEYQEEEEEDGHRESFSSCLYQIFIRSVQRTFKIMSTIIMIVMAFDLYSRSIASYYKYYYDIQDDESSYGRQHENYDHQNIDSKIWISKFKNFMTKYVTKNVSTLNVIVDKNVQNIRYSNI